MGQTGGGALLGALTAQLHLGLPAIGGKDSMSGSFENLDVPPTLVSFAVAMTKASRTMSAALQDPGAKLVLFPLPEDEATHLPDFEALPNYYQNVLSMIHGGEVRAAGVVKEGGVAAEAAKMAFGNRVGVVFDPSFLDAEKLFCPAERFAAAADGTRLRAAGRRHSGGRNLRRTGDRPGRRKAGPERAGRNLEQQAGKNLPPTRRRPSRWKRIFR